MRLIIKLLNIFIELKSKTKSMGGPEGQIKVHMAAPPIESWVTLGEAVTLG